MENDKILSFEDIIKVKELEKNNVQEKIHKEISKIIEEKKAITTEGYNLYERIKRR